MPFLSRLFAWAAVARSALPGPRALITRKELGARTARGHSGVLRLEPFNLLISSCEVVDPSHGEISGE